VPPTRSQPDLTTVIATLLGELERFRKELVLREEAWAETQSKIDVLKPIANEKFHSKLAEYNAMISARTCPEGLRMPDRYDVPEGQEIELLQNSLQPISRLPGIDPQARIMLLWLSSDPQAKVALDELDKLLRRPSLENVNGMIALLKLFPGAVPPTTLRDSSVTAPNGSSEQNAQASPPGQHSDGFDDEPRIAAFRAARQTVVMPILASKGWTRCKWATKAGVSKNSVYDYLDGERKLSVANRRALAEVLELKPDDLPD
jgi:hypothetical protein